MCGEKGTKKVIKIEFECWCNLECKYCFLEDIYRVDSDAVLLKILNIINRYDKERTVFRIEGIGEITLYPNIVDALDKLAQKGYQIKALSNGVNYDLIQKNNNIAWSISLDGNTEQMNCNRNLNQNTIQQIIEVILSSNLDIQCVYANQTIDELNQFIDYLKFRDYHGRLNIFPVKKEGNSVSTYLPYEKLHKAAFIPEKEYFEQWEQIYLKRGRTNVCNFFRNGYVYRIMHDGETVKQIKCDCGEFPYESEELKRYDMSYCDSCINHYEYEVY